MKITFTDKTSIDNRPDLSDVEKITGRNINEIKNVVNANADELESTKVKTENLSTEVEALKQKDTAQDTNIQSNTSKIEAINKNIEAINKKNTEQDTNIQSNTSKIEANQNNIKALQVENAEVKAENERLRSDIESISLPGEAEGESIDLDDSSGARFKKFGVSGNHSQETREGYNIVNLTSFPKGARNGITATVDLNKGSITLNGTCTGTFAYAIPLALNAGTVVSYGLNNLQTNSEVTMRFEVTDNTQEGQISCAQKNAKMENFALTKDTVSWQLRIGKGTVLTDFVIYPQIEVGSTLHKFETYGATPSLEIPSEIKTVKDNVNIVVCNKNLFDKNNATVVEFFVDGENKIQSWTDEVESIYIPIKSNTTYTVSKKISSRFTVATSNKVPVAGVEVNAVSNRTASNLTITSRDGDKYLLIFYYKKTDDTLNAKEIRDSIQIEKGSTATDYEAHQEQTITIPIQQEMLEGDYFDWKNEKQTNLFEKIVLNGVDKKCTAAKLAGDGNSFQWAFTVGQSLPYVRTVYSNVAKLTSDFGTVNGIRISANSTIAYVRSKIEVLNGKEATVENVNELLKTMYDNGNPATFYIEKASKKELDFTDEQKAVAKQIKETLHTYKNITHIYSTDETRPIMNAEYAKDLNTVINNMQAQIINNASEEVNG